MVMCSNVRWLLNARRLTDKDITAALQSNQHSRQPLVSRDFFRRTMTS